MKRRIEQLLNGIFEYEQGQLVIRPEELRLGGAPGEVLHGKFFVEGAAGQRVHGFLYPSDARMICEPAEFHGTVNEIHYQFDCSGLKQGSVSEGKILVCSDCGEYRIPCTVSIAAGSVGRELPFSDLDGFAGLARTDAETACRAFWTTEFQSLLQEDPKLCALYEGLTLSAAGYQGEAVAGSRSAFMRHAMEEFLIGSGRKDAITLTIDGPNEGMQSFGMLENGAYEWRCGEIREPLRETLCLHKSTWGFEEISVESDALFVRPERKYFTTEDFAGSSMDLHLILDANLMHAGINYARITLTAGRQTMQVLVSAKKPGKAGSRQAHIRKIMTKKLENNYIDFRLKKMDLETWIERSVSVINSYKRAGGDDPFADLFLVQLYFADDKKHRAAKLLEQIEAQKNRLDTPERYCFYLYISTFLYREASYVDRVEEEVVGQYYRNRSSWPLMWILLYLQENYLNDPDARYEAVAEQFRSGGSDLRSASVGAKQSSAGRSAPSPGLGGRMQSRSGERFALRDCGCRSRIMYVEAYQALRGNPFLLRHLGEFELHLLRFADQEKVMTAEILRQVANLSMHQTEFDRRLFDILSHGYQVYPSEDLLKAICQILLKGQKTDPVYFQWYALGVENGLRLNGLYEAYMQTMDCTDFQALPQIIRMYFPYDTSLDYRRRAALYRSIAQNRKSDPQTWLNHRPAMERFVMDQIELGHITDDLAALYLDFLKEPMITDSLAKKLIRLILTCEVTCGAAAEESSRSSSGAETGQASEELLRSPAAGGWQIVLHSCRLSREITAGLADGKGQIRICDPDSAVFLKDETGRRYAVGDSCRIRCYMEDERLLVWCAKKAPEDPNLVVYLTAECQRDQVMEEQLLPYFMAGCELAGISEGFRDGLRKQVLTWYMEHPMDDTLPDFLDRISYDDYIQIDKTALITLLAEESRCAEAFELLNRYGAEGIPLLQMVRICSRMVLELEFEENVMLLSLCHECFVKGKYDDKLLRYLLLYYEGSVEDMKLVWSAACEFGLDTMLLEEKILMMMLFTRQGTEGSEPIFESYRKKLGRKKLCRAYVNLKSYEYFVKGLPVAEPVFVFIENEYRRFSGTDRLAEQEEVCRLALLQYYARAVSLTKTQRVYAAEMLEEFITKGMRFAFYLRFDEALLSPWQLEGHVFAEYAGNPKSTVTIEYRIRRQGETAEVPWTREPVPDCFEGIFVREFTLFADEEVECRFIEEFPDGKDSVHSKEWVLRANREDTRPGMYSLLNRLCKAVSDKDESGASDALDSWLTLEYLAKEVFTLV